MTTVVRHVKNTSTAANVNVAVGSTGKDYQLRLTLKPPMGLQRATMPIF